MKAPLSESIEARRNLINLERTTVERKQPHKQRQRFFTQVAAGFGLASAILIVIGVFSYRSLTALVETSNLAAHSHKVVEKLEEVLSQIKDAETGQRGYVITGEEPYLEPYYSAIGVVDQQVKDLRTLTADNPNQQRWLDTLEPLIAQRLAVSKQIIDLRKNQGFEGASQLVLTGKGKHLMDDIRKVIHKMENEEKVLLIQRSQAASSSARNTILTFSSGIFLTFFILAGVYHFIYREISQHQRTEAALQQERDFTTIVLNTASALVVVLDRQGRIVRINRACEQTTGYSFAEVRGKYFWDLFLMPEEVEQVRAVFDNLRGGQLSNQHENYWVTRDGDRRLIAWSNTLLCDQVDAVDYIISTGIDITVRASAESALSQANEKLTGWVNELQQRNREIALMGKMSDVLQACLTVEEAYSAIATLVQPLFPQTSGGIFLINASKNLVEAVATWGDAPTSSEKLFAPHDCWALRRGRVHWVENTHSGLICKHVHHDSSPAESLCLPMMAQGDALGMLYLSTQELGRLTEIKQQLAVAVAEQIALALANLKLRSTLHNQSIRDPLTGLFNRRYMEESLQRELHRCDRLQQSLGIIMLDVDHFKRFNDTFGHEAGDAVLRELSQFLQNHIRKSDIACRYGGEELTLILPEASLEIVQQRAEQIREGIKHLNVYHDRQPLGAISLSLGVACFPEHGSTGEAVIRAADAALYSAKKSGRDRVVTAS